jgi:anaerobic selenocysteine-containing dehydrogenase
MQITRRKFLHYTSAIAGLVVLEQSGLLSLRKLSEAEAATMRTAMGTYQVKYTADAFCPAECGLEMWVQDGVIKKIYGNQEVPMNDGTCCAKGASGQQLVYSPYRLKHPMKRVGARGEGKFKRISWDEAIDILGGKLTEIKKKYGAESVIMDCGDVTDRDNYYRIAHAFGTPHCCEHGAICDTPRRHGPKLILGGKRIEPDIMTPKLVRQADGSLKKEYGYKTKLIIYNGWNPFVATRIYYENRGTVGAQVENGCKVVVIDPSLSNTASRADQWLAPRAGTDGDLFAAMLRYILENDNPQDKDRAYIDWNMRKFVTGWDEFMDAFKAWWGKKDPINGLSYFSTAWAADRTGLTEKEITDLAHQFGITKPAALVWGMQSPGHHYNGYCCSIIGTVLNIITGNFDVPGGAIDTELVKVNKGGPANGSAFKKRKVKRTINGQEVEAELGNLHMDNYGGRYPAAWDDSVADFPHAFMHGVELKYGPFRGHKFPIKAFLLRTGNAVYTGSNPAAWKEALTAKDASGEYKVALSVFIDTLYLESALYADLILPEASYAERMSLSDIYPSHQVVYNRDEVIKPLHECKKPFEIMNLLAKKLRDLGDTDIDPKEFWKKYGTEEDFTNEMLSVSPGRANVGSPLPYPKYPEGYTLVGTPDSLEAGRVKIDDEKKKVVGEPLTVAWLREHHGVAIWPMSWQRYKKSNADEPNKFFPSTDTKTIEFVWDFEVDGKRKGRYANYNQLIEKAGNEGPKGLAEIGMTKFPKTFYWFETKWNPYTNPEYKKYAGEYPFQLICGRVHHAMSGTQMIPWLGEVKTEGIWQPMNEEFTAEVPEAVPAGKEAMMTVKKTFAKDSYSVGTIWMNADDAKKAGVKNGDLVELKTPLGHATRGKIFASGGMRPGVIKLGFATGNRFCAGLGPAYESRKYTPSHNDLVDPDAMSPIMGFPAYADMLVAVRKV